MNSSAKNILLYAVLSAIICLSSCGKSSPGLIGSWWYSSSREQTLLGGTVVSDTSIDVSGQIYNFTSTGQFSVSLPHVAGLSDLGTYIATDTSVTVSDTLLVPHMTVINYQISSLTYHSLVLVRRDTAATSPHYVHIYTGSFTH